MREGGRVRFLPQRLLERERQDPGAHLAADVLQIAERVALEQLELEADRAGADPELLEPWPALPLATCERPEDPCR